MATLCRAFRPRAGRRCDLAVQARAVSPRRRSAGRPQRRLFAPRGFARRSTRARTSPADRDRALRRRGARRRPLYSAVGVTPGAGARADAWSRLLAAQDAGLSAQCADAIATRRRARLRRSRLLIDDDSRTACGEARSSGSAGGANSSFALGRRRRAWCAGRFSLAHGRGRADRARRRSACSTRKRHADTTLVRRPRRAAWTSRENYRYIVADEATGVFQGKVIVPPHAQKTDGGMKSQAILLLADGAAMNNKPELEIFADDVVCGHGATVGALDPEQRILRRRAAFPHDEAEAMLLEAFGGRGDRQLDDADAARDRCCAAMRAWLAAGTRRSRREPDRTARPRPTTSQAIRADFPILERAALRQAAGLSRQCRLRAKAARRDRRA